MLTKKDFIKLAQTLKENRPVDWKTNKDWQLAVSLQMQLCKQSNPRFDDDKFAAVVCSE